MVFSTKATTSGSERHSYGCNVTTNLTQLSNAALPPTHLDLRTREHTAIWLAPGSNAIRNWERETWSNPGPETRPWLANRSKIRLDVFLRAVRLNSSNTHFSVLRGDCRYANSTIRNATVRKEHSRIRFTDERRRTHDATNSDAGVPVATDSPNRDTLRLNSHTGDAEDRRLRNTLVTDRPPHLTGSQSAPRTRSNRPSLFDNRVALSWPTDGILLDSC